MPDALRSCGLRVEVHDDHFDPREPDVSWIREVGARGWVVLTSDKGIRRRVEERESVIQSRGRLFVVVAAGLRGHEKAALVVKHAPKILRVARGVPPPFIAGVSRTGVAIYRW